MHTRPLTRAEPTQSPGSPAKSKLADAVCIPAAEHRPDPARPAQMLVMHHATQMLVIRHTTQILVIHHTTQMLVMHHTTQMLVIHHTT